MDDDDRSEWLAYHCLFAEESKLGAPPLCVLCGSMLRGRSHPDLCRNCIEGDEAIELFQAWAAWSRRRRPGD